MFYLIYLFQDREIKRQQTVIMKQQEKERRKQHLMMIRALESQRKAEVCQLISLPNTLKMHCSKPVLRT